MNKNTWTETEAIFPHLMLNIKLKPECYLHNKKSFKQCFHDEGGACQESEPALTVCKMASNPLYLEVMT